MRFAVVDPFAVLRAQRDRAGNDGERSRAADRFVIGSNVSAFCIRYAKRRRVFRFARIGDFRGRSQRVRMPRKDARIFAAIRNGILRAGMRGTVVFPCAAARGIEHLPLSDRERPRVEKQRIVGADIRPVSVFDAELQDIIRTARIRQPRAGKQNFPVPFQQPRLPVRRGKRIPAVGKGGAVVNFRRTAGRHIQRSLLHRQLAGDNPDFVPRRYVFAGGGVFDPYFGNILPFPRLCPLVVELRDENIAFRKRRGRIQFIAVEVQGRAVVNALRVLHAHADFARRKTDRHRDGAENVTE